MTKFQSLNQYQKIVLLILAAMTALFSILYLIAFSRKGFAYKDTILIPSQEEGSAVYSGKIEGQLARFTVSPDKTVLFQYGDKTYGPYTAREDVSAIPKGNDHAESMTGIEILRGDEIMFRGAMLDLGNLRVLYNEDGSPETLSIFATMSDGRVVNQYGHTVDPMEPSVSDLLNLMAGPELTHKGEGAGWFGGVFFCVVTAISILFADELFRWQLMFRVQNVENVEPSEWEITGRYISWTVLPVAAIVIFVIGLK